MFKRGSGILLHITSLPSKFGIGDLGENSYKFVDFLSETKQRYWQILPLNPTSIVFGNSPYSTYSVFAGNKFLISPETLVTEKFILESDINNIPEFKKDKVEYKNAIEYKEKILKLTFERNKEILIYNEEFTKFCSDNIDWLFDYSLFIALKEKFQDTVWLDWPEEIKNREESAIKYWDEELKIRILEEKFYQFLFFKQWLTLKKYADSKNVLIIGDMPIYVNFDSSDVWTNPKNFKLDENKNPTHVAGVPPDYYSATGQLWGNPIYNWDYIKENNFSWWINRIKHNLKLYNILRLDHFRGFVGYWEIPFGEKTAMNGTWKQVPAYNFFSTIFENFSECPIIAEDLGTITQDVIEVIKFFNFTRMKVLIFAFGDDVAKNPYAPHNFINNCIVYSGTHDSNTIRGWFENEIGMEVKNKIFKYIGKETTSEEISWEMIKLALLSVADIAMIPMQDILSLGEKARMNRPSTTHSNWEWKLDFNNITPQIKEKIILMTEIYGRA